MKTRIKIFFSLIIFSVLCLVCAVFGFSGGVSVFAATTVTTTTPTWTGYSDGHVEATASSTFGGCSGTFWYIGLYDYGYGVPVKISCSFTTFNVSWSTSGSFAIYAVYEDSSGNIKNAGTIATIGSSVGSSAGFTMIPPSSEYKAAYLYFSLMGSSSFTSASLALSLSESYVSYTITYSAGDGTGEDFEVDSFKYGESYSLLSFFDDWTAPDNKYFSGWSDGTNTYSAGDSVTVVEDTTFTAVYSWDSYQITYAQSGASPFVFQYDYGTEIKLMSSYPSSWTVPTDNYFKNQWSDGTDTYNAGASYTVTGNVTFSPVFGSCSSSISDYIGFSDGSCYCTFSLMIGSVSSETSILRIPLYSYGYGAGAKITITLVSANVSYSGSSVSAAAYIMIYSTEDGSGNYIKQSSSFSFSANGSVSVTVSTVTAGQYLSYIELYSNASFTSAVISGRVDESPIYSDITYSAGDGTGSDKSVNNICVGTNYTLAAFSDMAFTAPTGCHFVSWSDGTNTYSVGADVVATETMTFTAQYEVNTYTVTYTSAFYTSGYGTVSGGTYEHGTEITLADCPSIFNRSGYTFAGWTIDDGVTVYAAGRAWVLVSDITFEAVYDLASSDSGSDTDTETIKYLITYLVGDGTGETLYVYVIEGDTFYLESFPASWKAPDGQIFSGWKLEKVTYGINTSFKAQKDMTFTATYQSDGKSTDGTSSGGATTSSDDDNSDKVIKLVVGVGIVVAVICVIYKIYTVARREK